MLAKGFGNALVMKRNNQQAILDVLRLQSLSRSELARQLGLTRAALGVHADAMIASGLIEETGIGKARRGRKPILLDINPTYRSIGGLYLSRNVCQLGITNLKGNLMASVALDTRELTAPDALCANIAGQWDALLARAGVSKENVAVLGVSAPGPVDVSSGVILTPPDFEAWHAFPLAERLEEALGVAVFLENNAASQALAELRFGHGRTYQSFLFVVVDSGIGGGIIQNGSLVRGSCGWGGEIGHTCIDLNGRPCSCGNVGCLERYACIPALLKDLFSPEEGYTQWKQVVDGAQAGVERCQKALEQEAHYLSCALASFVNLFEPETIVLGGDLLYRPQAITALIQEDLQRRVLMRQVRKVTVLPSALNGPIDVLAAATVGLDAFFQDVNAF